MATFALTDFHTIDEFLKVLSQPQVIGTKSGNDIADYISLHRWLAKEQFIRQPLLLECQKRFLTQVESWRTSKRAQLNERLSAIERDNKLADRSGKLSVSGVIGSDGEFFETSSSGEATKPVTHYQGEAPTNGTSGTLAGVAENGEVLFNTSTDLGYMNKGTKASPIWSRFIAEDGIDFILNPTELKYPSIWATALSIVNDGTYNDRMNYQSPVSVNFLSYSKEDIKANYKDALKMAMPLIQFDISNDGIISSYERSTTIEELVFF